MGERKAVGVESLAVEEEGVVGEIGGNAFVAAPGAKFAGG